MNDNKNIYTDIIWDFNGTLLDDREAARRAVNTLLSRRGLSTIESVEKYHTLFGFPIEDYYKKLGFDFTKEKYTDLAHEWVAEYNIESKNATLCAGVAEMLEYFKKEGMKQYILSASERDMMLRQLEALKITRYFEEILGTDNIYAESKTNLADIWRRGRKDSRVLFIGDTVHDCQVARLMDADCVLIANGHQSKATLLTCGVPVFDSVIELLGYTK